MLPPPPLSPPLTFFWLHSDDIGAPIFIIFIHPILKASGEVGTGGIVDLSQSIIYYSIRSTDHLVRRSISAACRMRVSSGEDDKCSSLVLFCFVGVIVLSHPCSVANPVYSFYSFSVNAPTTAPVSTLGVLLASFRLQSSSSSFTLH